MTKSKKDTRIAFGEGNFICVLCNYQYSFMERSRISIETEDGTIGSICKPCEKKLDPNDYETVYSYDGCFFRKHDRKSKIIYLLKKKLRLVH